MCGFFINKKGAKYEGGKILLKKRENVESKIWQNDNNNNNFQRSAVMQSQGTEGSFGKVTLHLFIACWYCFRFRYLRQLYFQF